MRVLTTGPDQRRWWMVMLMAALVYANALGGAFLWDDLNLILTNTRTHGLEQLPNLLGFGDARFGFRMVRDLSYALDYSLAGGTVPWVYHLSNVIYHAITSGLVMLLIGRLTGNGSAAFWGGLLFAVHPIHVDAVTYISGRRDILSALFYLAGLLTFIRYREHRKIGWFGLAILSAVLGVMAKETVATLPIAWLLYDSWHAAGRDGMLRGMGRALSRHWLLYGSGGLLAAGFVAYVVLAQGLTHGAGPYGGNVPTHIMTEVVILAYALKMLVLPTQLLIDYQHYITAVTSPTDLRFLLSAAVLPGLIAATTWGFAKRRTASFAAHWLWITYLPMMQIVPHPERFAEHYLYLPSVGACMLAGMAIAGLMARSARPPRWALYGAIVLVLLLGLRTLEHNRTYADPITAFEAGLRIHPDSMRMTNNLALSYAAVDQPDRAIALLREAVQKIPGPLMTRNLGTLLRDAGQFAEAERWLLDAYARNPKDLKTLEALGDIFTQQGKWADTLRAWTELLALNPHSKAALVGLGNRARMAGELDRAADYYRRATRFHPNDPAGWSGLGITQQTAGDLDAARTTFTTVLQLSPDDVDAWNNLGVIALQHGNPAQAEHAFTQVLKSATPPPATYLNLARLKVLRGDCLGAAAIWTQGQSALSSLPAHTVKPLARQLRQRCTAPQSTLPLPNPE